MSKTKAPATVPAAKPQTKVPGNSVALATAKERLAEVNHRLAQLNEAEFSDDWPVLNALRGLLEKRIALLLSKNSKTGRSRCFVPWPNAKRRATKRAAAPQRNATRRGRRGRKPSITVELLDELVFDSLRRATSSGAATWLTVKQIIDLAGLKQNSSIRSRVVAALDNLLNQRRIQRKLLDPGKPESRRNPPIFACDA